MTQNPPRLEFFKCFLCPRCLLVKKELTRLRQIYPSLAVEEVDVFLNPLQAWSSGIRMIPALRSGDETLSGLLLKEAQIRPFVARHLNGSGQERQDAPSITPS